MYKKDIINFLFVASFPVLGIGFFISGKYSPSVGSFVGVIPYILIIGFYLLDLLYTKEFNLKLNAGYFLFLAFIITTIVSFYISLNKNYPYFTSLVAWGKALVIVLPFHAFIAVSQYNDRKELPRLALLSLSLLIVVNMFGFFVLRLENATHSIEGRVNFPFLDSFYSGAGVLCLIALMLFYRMKENWVQPGKMTWLIIYLLVTLILIFFINSRLMILLFMMIFVLLILGVKSRLIFFVALFTLPILLNATKLIYDILSLPVFSSILQRVDMEDVMTFNGRSYLWENTIDWLLDDQRGLLFGNGFRGHYFLRLIDDIMVIWQVKPYNSHLHSTALWVLVDQGLLGYLFFILILWRIFIYFRSELNKKNELSIFYPVALYMLFVVQFDAFGYLDNMGGTVLALLFSMTVVQSDNNTNIQLNSVK